MDKKIIIIGSCSFLGSHFVHHGVSQGLTVLGLNHTPPKSIPFTPYHWKIGKLRNLSLKQLDPNNHLKQITDIINDCQPHYIIDCSDNNHIRVQHQSKLCSLRIPSTTHIYGPGQQVHEIIPNIIVSILLGKKIPLDNKSHAIRSFIHINDIVSSTFKELHAGLPKEIHHLPNYYSASIRDLVAFICRRMSVPFEDAVTIVEDSSSKDTESLSEHTKSHSELSLHPNIHYLENGIDSVIAWAQEWLPALKNHLAPPFLPFRPSPSTRKE